MAEQHSPFNVSRQATCAFFYPFLYSLLVLGLYLQGQDSGTNGLSLILGALLWVFTIPLCIAFGVFYLFGIVAASRRMTQLAAQVELTAIATQPFKTLVWPLAGSGAIFTAAIGAAGSLLLLLGGLGIFFAIHWAVAAAISYFISLIFWKNQAQHLADTLSRVEVAPSS